MIERYEYGKVEDFGFIADHASDQRGYVEHGMRFRRIEDFIFVRALLDYFHVDSEKRMSDAAMDACIKALPDQGQWRQGASTHQLAIWPENPDPKKVVIDGYWGDDAIQVGDFHHGCYTWFCLMAQAYIAAKAMDKREESKG